MRKFLIIIASALATTAFAQQAGYIITVNADTVRGKFKKLQPATSSLRVTFQADADSEYKQYTPFQIKAWQLDIDGQLFESKMLSYKEGGQPFGVYMRRLNRAGEIVLYEFFNSSGDVGMTQFYLERNQKLTEVKMGNQFYKQLAEFFKDNQELSTKLTQKQFKRTELLKIVEEHNAWLEKKWN